MTLSRTLTLICLSALAITMSQCKKKPARNEAPAPQARNMKLSTEAAFQSLPDGGDGYAVLQVDWVRKQLLTGVGAILPGAKMDGAATLREIKQVCQAHLGLDCTSFTWAAAYVSIKERAAGLVLAGVPGSLKLNNLPKQTVAGVSAYKIAGKIFLVHHGAHLFAGNKAGLEALLAVSNGKRSSFRASKSALHKLIASAAGAGDLALVAGDLTMAPIPLKPQRLLLSANAQGLIRVVAQGDDQVLKQLKALALGQLRKGHSATLQALVKARQKKDFAETVIATLARDQLAALLRGLDLPVRGGEMTLELNLGKVSSFLPLLGVMSAVAIPAFVRYMRRAKTSEAVQMLNKIERGAFRYASRSWPDSSGTPQPCQFPKSTNWTPIGSACSSADGKYAPSDAAWNTPTWQALLFKLSDAHYYQYRFISTGKGNGATYTIQARGDLDCDGTYALFEISGKLLTGPMGILNCRVQKSAGVRIENETE